MVKQELMDWKFCSEKIRDVLKAGYLIHFQEHNKKLKAEQLLKPESTMANGTQPIGISFTT